MQRPKRRDRFSGNEPGAKISPRLQGRELGAPEEHRINKRNPDVSVLLHVVSVRKIHQTKKTNRVPKAKFLVMSFENLFTSVCTYNKQEGKNAVPDLNSENLSFQSTPTVTFDSPLRSKKHITIFCGIRGMHSLSE